MHPGFHAPDDDAPRGRGERPRRDRALARMLRGAVLLTAASLLPGCLVDEPPEFEDSEQTAPILYLDQSLPRTTTFFPTTSNTTIDFSIRLQSNDLQETVIAYPWLNLGLEGEKYLTPQPISPGVFDLPRDATFKVVIPSGYQGCVPLTILFFHEDDYDAINPGKPKEGAPVSRATWWLLVDADPEDVTIADCPNLPNDAPPQQ